MVRLKMFSVMVMVLVLSSVVYGQTLGKESIKGLNGVRVIVEKLDSDIEEDGLRISSIQTDVEVKLRMAGIKVLTKEEWLKEPGMPWLYVKVNSLKDEEIRFYAYSIGVELNQNAFLERDVKIRCIATTWTSTGRIGTVGANNVNSFRDRIKDKVDKFINDYLEMNPKE